MRRAFQPEVQKGKGAGFGKAQRRGAADLTKARIAKPSASQGLARRHQLRQESPGVILGQCGERVFADLTTALKKKPLCSLASQMHLQRSINKVHLNANHNFRNLTHRTRSIDASSTPISVNSNRRATSTGGLCRCCLWREARCPRAERARHRLDFTPLFAATALLAPTNVWAHR